MTRRQGDVTTNEPFSGPYQNEPSIEAAAILPEPPATGEEDNISNIAMELGGGKPKKGRKSAGRAEWNCSPEYERSQGGTPRDRAPPLGSSVDDMQPPPWQEWSETDEEDPDDYSDLLVPDDLNDDYYWSP